MRQRKVLAIFGTRPEAIKMAPVIAALKDSASMEVRVCVTAQHRELLDQVLELFAITTDHDLGIMRPDQDLFDLTARLLLGIRSVIEEEQPELVLVQGDTTTCFAGALAAFYCGVPVGHIEAGLRTHDLGAPFPEEANRVLTSSLTRFHFAPTEKARKNLIAENVDPGRIWVTGNTGIDALFHARSEIENAPKDGAETAFDRARDGSQLPKPSRLILVTGHRRENFGGPIAAACDAIKTLAAKHSDWVFVYPVHPNPNIEGPVREILKGLANVHLPAPLDYRSFVETMMRSDLILTDSGGIQEEAPSLGKPVLVMRDVTERPEAVEAGTVKLVGTDQQAIVRTVEMLLSNEAAYRRMARTINPYGDGKASGRIVKILQESFESKQDAHHELRRAPSGVS